MKPQMPTLTPKISDLLFMTWHSWRELRKPKPKICSHAGTICPLQFKSFSCCSCIFFFGLNKKNEKNLATTLGDLHLHWCTYIDRERVLKAKRWEIRKNVKEETGTELLINQGVDVRFQNMWWVEYQRVKE